MHVIREKEADLSLHIDIKSLNGSSRYFAISFRFSFRSDYMNCAASCFSSIAGAVVNGDGFIKRLRKYIKLPKSAFFTPTFLQDFQGSLLTPAPAAARPLLHYSRGGQW